ncbi:MAG: zinc-binding alcohol dehydrogenase, partial [Planctomycetes bacterium]|nr:zinc-binding alcohol dehydrogenase [Planctomycetota bacterium]
TETRGIIQRRRTPVEPVDEVEPYGFGYSNSGVVEETGEETEHIAAGCRAACYGAPYVRHAEWNLVPRNLVHPVPEGVSLREAAFTGVGTIGVHAVRRGRFEFGEKVLVVGLGILGNLTAQILAASGVDVLASELLAFRREKAGAAGVRTIDPAKEDLPGAVDAWTGGAGLDGAVILTSTENVGMVNGVLRLCREKGRVVLVGGGGTGFDREVVFKKELDVLVPRAGGGGRYDAWYEEEGNDPPMSMIRWTEGRNMGAWLWLVSTGRVRVEQLITHEYPFAEAEAAFDKLIECPGETLGVLLRYPPAEGD